MSISADKKGSIKGSSRANFGPYMMVVPGSGVVVRPLRPWVQPLQSV